MKAPVTEIVVVSRDVVMVNCWLLTPGIMVRVEENKRTITRYRVRCVLSKSHHMYFPSWSWIQLLPVAASDTY